MVSRLYDPKHVLSHEHVNILYAGSVKLSDLDGWDLRKRLVCFEDKQITLDHLEAYRSCHPMFVIFDSGAFSAWTKGKVINIDEFVESFVENSDIINMAANLDVIPGRKGLLVSEEDNKRAPIEGWMNYLYILNKLKWLGREDLCSRVMPIHHQGEDIDILKMMLDFGCEYIGISPSNDARSTQRMKYLDDVFHHLSKQPKRILTHGYAVTGESLVASYPFFTVDSISWIFIAGLGVIKTPFGSFTFSEDPRSLKSKDNLRIVIDSDGTWDMQNSEFKEMSDDIRKYIVETLMLDANTLAQDYWARALANIIYFENFEKTTNVQMRGFFEKPIELIQ